MKFVKSFVERLKDTEIDVRIAIGNNWRKKNESAETPLGSDIDANLYLSSLWVRFG